MRPELNKKGETDWIIALVMATIILSASILLIYPFGPTGKITGATGYGVAAATNISLLYTNYSYYEEEGGSKAGESVIAVDLGGDNNTDLLIGAPGFNNGDGKVYGIYRPFINGSHNLSEANLSWVGGTTNESFGFDLSAGDINNDGLLDLAFGARWKDDALTGFTEVGGAYLVYGDGNLDANSTNISAVSNVTFYGEATNDQAGSSLAIGDINNDNYDDLVIGAPLYDNFPNTDDGKTYIFYGPISNNESLNLALANVTLVQEQNLSQFGSEIVLSDLNNDGVDDMLLGAPGISVIYLIYGPFISALPVINISLAANATFNGTLTSTTGAAHTISVGNVNNDSYQDIFIGSPYDKEYGGIYGSGRAFLVYGNSSFNGSYDLNTTYPQFIPEATDDAVGFSIGLDDHDGDGLDDMFIGAPGNDEGGNLAGKIYMFYSLVANNTYNVSTANESWIGSAAGQSLGLIHKGSTIFSPILEGTGSFTLTIAGEPAPVPAISCGDGICNGGETCAACPGDCGTCPASGGGGGGRRARPDCNNNRDDDGDGLTDYPLDPGCSNYNDNDESNEIVCVEDYSSCTEWEKDCVGGIQTRECADANSCTAKKAAGKVDVIIKGKMPSVTRECFGNLRIVDRLENYGSCIGSKYMTHGDLGGCKFERCLSEKETASISLTESTDFSGGFDFNQIKDNIFWIVYDFDGSGVIEVQLNKEWSSNFIYNLLGISGEHSLWTHMLEFDAGRPVIAGMEISCDTEIDADSIAVTYTNSAGLISTVEEKIPEGYYELVIDSDFNILDVVEKFGVMPENELGPYALDYGGEVVTFGMDDAIYYFEGGEIERKPMPSSVSVVYVPKSNSDINSIVFLQKNE